jgi:hypothetical protein
MLPDLSLECMAALKAPYKRACRACDNGGGGTNVKMAPTPFVETENHKIRQDMR